MKKILILFLVGLLFGCLSFFDPWAPRKVTYKVIHKDIDSLENPFSTDELIFYKTEVDKISVTKWTSSKRVHFSIDVEYTSSSWRFMDGIVRIKTDDDLHKYSDKEPYTTVLYGGTVMERVCVTVPAELIVEMATSEIVRIEFHGEPITVTSEGIGLLKQFCAEYIE